MQELASHPQIAYMIYISYIPAGVEFNYHQIYNIMYTKLPNWNISRHVLQFSVANPLKPGVTSRMKM